MTTETFTEFVQHRFGGVLRTGSHNPNGEACFHEALNVWQGREWSDDTSGTLDLRLLNDARWSSDEARTEAMLPLGPLVLAWPSWSQDRQHAFAGIVAEQTIRQVVPIALRVAATLNPSHAAALEAAAVRCADEGTAEAAWAAWAAEAARAARAAWAAAEAAWAAREAAWAARAAREAAWAAWAAAEAAAEAESDELLHLMVAILLDAEEATR